MSDLKKLKEDAKDISILHVEDNTKLKLNASKFLKKFFNTLYTASDGQEGLNVFKEFHPQIVITDINMPKLNGIELSRLIKKNSPDTKIIIMSAFDTNKNLHECIEIGVSKFLKKPVNAVDFSNILHLCVKEIKKEKDLKIFHMHLGDIFNYQSSMVVMMQDQKIIFTNQMFLNFFNVKNIEEFKEKNDDLGALFLEHGGFLYNKVGKNWFDEIKENKTKLHHVKLIDSDSNQRHFILKYQTIPEKKSYSIISFDDITELNLLKLFDKKSTDNIEKIKNKKAMFDLFKVIQRNNAKVILHNYYKELSVSNDAIITKIDDNSITLKTNYTQQKAMQFERKAIIESEALPKVVFCEKVKNISFSDQTVELKKMRFLMTSPSQRSTIRIIPEKTHSISLFLNKNKFQGEVRIEDICINAVKLRLNALPSGLHKDTEIIIDMVFNLENKPIIINTKATMYRSNENAHSCSVVFLFDKNKKNELVKYISKRQIAIIKEFKGLQNEQQL